MCKNKQDCIKKILLGVFFIAIFICLYVFFRHVHPTVPWDGDDWDTIGLKCNPTALPNIAFWESERMMCSIMGAFFGHVAAFIVYPFVNDYVLSFVIVVAFCLALVIWFSFVYLYIFLERFTKNSIKTILGVLFFIGSAFLIFKSTEQCSYLYWHYNLCSVFFYCIPSYLASIVSLYLISCEIWDVELGVNIKTAFLIAFIYFLIFSFLPAAILLSIVSFLITVLNIYILYNKRRKIDLIFLKTIAKKCYIHIWALLLFLVKLYMEIIKVFGIGYIEKPNGIWQSIKVSFSFIISTFNYMNRFFVVIALLLVCFTVVVLFFNKKDVKTIVLKKTAYIFILALMLLFLFFTLFGALSLGHLAGTGNAIRLDTMYVLYFMFIISLVLCLEYLLKRSSLFLLISPLVILMMFSIVICPKNSYSDSFYSDTTPQQKYEIMVAIIDEIQARDADNNPYLTVHMPLCSHYAGSGLVYSLEISNMINHYVQVDFVYEENIKTVYFE